MSYTNTGTAWLDDPIQDADTRPTSGTYVNPGSAIIPGALGLLSPAGIIDENAIFPFNVTTPNTGISQSGAAVAIDTTAANSVRLANPGDKIFGRLEQVEPRATFAQVVGSVCIRGGLTLPLDSTAGAVFPAIGDCVQGGTILGTVVKLAAFGGQNSTVVFVDTVNLVCTVIF
jgi:hypothetical protein